MSRIIKATAPAGVVQSKTELTHNAPTAQTLISQSLSQVVPAPVSKGIAGTEVET